MWPKQLWITTAHHISFLLNWFSFEYRFLFPILHFLTVKSPSITKRLVSQENAFKKSKNPSLSFFHKTIGWNSLFYSNWKQFQVFLTAKIEFRVKKYTVAYGKTVPSCDPLANQLQSYSSSYPLIIKDSITWKKILFYRHRGRSRVCWSEIFTFFFILFISGAKSSLTYHKKSFKKYDNLLLQTLSLTWALRHDIF